MSLRTEPNGLVQMSRSRVLRRLLSRGPRTARRKGAPSATACPSPRCSSWPSSPACCPAPRRRPWRRPRAPVISTPAADGYDLDGDLTLAGTAEADSTVELFDGATSVGTTTATGGTWTIALTGVADGVHPYTATATDAAPNTSPASNVRTITVDTVDPTVTDRSPLANATGVAVGVTVSADVLGSPRPGDA